MTEFYMLGRQRGKTHRMLQWMREAPEGETRVVVSVNNIEAMRLLRLAREEEGNTLQSWQFVGKKKLTSPYIWTGVRNRMQIVLGLDNLDLMIHHMPHLRWPVGAISWSVSDDDEIVVDGEQENLVYMTWPAKYPETP